MSITRRAILGTAAAAMAGATPAMAQQCEIGPPKHPKGPLVFMDYDQVELDAAYRQELYQPLGERVRDRLYVASGDARDRIGEPLRQRYGQAEVETLDIYRTDRAKAPIFVFIHGGTWRSGSAWEAGYPAEMFVNAGAHYIAVDFASVTTVDGDLGVLAAQVRRAIAWVHRNSSSFDGDPARLYVGGHSSGGHLCAVALVTDWQAEFGLPADAIKGGLCMSGLYEMEPVRLSYRREYIAFTDEVADAMSPQRHIDKLAAPIVVSHGTFETPEFQRQARDFAAAVEAAGKPVKLIEGNYHHDEMAETLGNPYGPNGRAALTMMELAKA
ncbi:arylformamidase [Inquilinus ginsengisoli]|uniref:alpha/beta hydrolase n=1 Tax=Inquilinus ginsengisoli TaxID=363840 RepID=UPI003D1EE19F